MTEIRVLITGFQPFGGRARNSSWEGVNWINEPGLLVEELPVIWGVPTIRLGELVDFYRPSTVISFGQGKEREFALETRALNLRDHRPDESGDRGDVREKSPPRQAPHPGQRLHVQRPRLLRLPDHAPAPLQLRGPRLHRGGAAARVVCEPRLEHALLADGLHVEPPCEISRFAADDGLLDLHVRK